MLTDNPVDLPELRRLAEAAREASTNPHGLRQWYRDQLLDDLRTALTPAAVLALLDRIDALAEELEDWEASHDDLAAEHVALQEFARTMATAIGWEAPGDTWVQKAIGWRQDPEALPGLYAELNRLRPIARAVAAIDDPTTYLRDIDAHVCVLCADDPHEDDCPWVEARSYVAEHRADPGAVAGEPESEETT